jgi:hypothetical protein
MTNPFSGSPAVCNNPSAAGGAQRRETAAPTKHGTDGTAELSPGPLPATSRTRLLSLPPFLPVRAVDGSNPRNADWEFLPRQLGPSNTLRDELWWQA